MLPNVASNSSSSSSNSNNRRYSLFSRSSNNNNPNPPLIGLIAGQSQSNEQQQDGTHLGKRLLNRRGTLAAPKMTAANSGAICHRCKRFEVDLTNTSDDLSATDAELKASRQVISLLQRQLELLRVEKAGLEKLIISQSSNSFAVDDAEGSNLTELLHQASKEGGDDNEEEEKLGLQIGDSQKVLLKLIQTQLYARDEEIVKLKSSLKETQNDKEQLQLQLHLIEEDNTRLKSENSVLSENISLRDQTIVSLSNEVFEQGNLNEYGQQQQSSQRRLSGIEPLGNQQQSLFKAQRHIAKLIDTLDAYKKTNELLSSNVMKLTDRCAQAEKKEVEIRSQCQELEAKCCQIQSKLLSLLKEIEQATSEKLNEGQEGKEQEVVCSESVKLLIKRLLEDKSLDIPLSWKEGNKSNNRNKRDESNNKHLKNECDELGFYVISKTLNDDDEKQLASNSNNESNQQASNRRRRHTDESYYHLETLEEEQESRVGDGKQRDHLRHMSVDSSKNDETQWHLKWDDFIKDFDKVDLSKSKDFKLLLRSGVPQEYRCKVWKSLIDLRIGDERRRHGPDYYQSLLEPNRPQRTPRSKTLNPASKQIELDLLRTLPNNKHFETLDSSGTVRLRRVLTAYSEHNPKVGYCQGMNRLAAVALLVVPEEEAFWCLVSIVDKIMPNGYYNDLWLAQVDSSVVMDFVAVKMPNLSEHFRRKSIELSLFAWFLTIFVDGTPPALFLRLWDSFLFEGDKILFRSALALLKMFKPQLLQLNNSVAVNNFLRSAVNGPIDLDLFFNLAYDCINPLSTSALKHKRDQHFQSMRSAFESVGKTFVASPSPANNEDQNELPVEDPSVISI